MTGDVLDLVLLAAAAVFAVSGYRQGFVVGVLSFLGFLGGGVVGAKIAPMLATGVLHRLPVGVVGLGTVFVLASLGQILATLVGGGLRRRLVWKPLRRVDNVAGALISVVSLLLVAWLVGQALASAPFPEVASQVRRSTVIDAVDKAIPASGQRFFRGFRQLVGDHGFPEVFGGLAPTQVIDVDPPDPALANSQPVLVARPDVLKIIGVASSCSRRIEGTGFVFAPGRVLTNAHVVAGVSDPQVQVGAVSLRARVVLYDPDRDLAVLFVPGLDRAPLNFAGPAVSGTGAVVVGYPNDGPFRADPARVRGTQKARGPDIYQQRTVVREIYALRARVQPGNSGGPLLDSAGRVLGVVFAAAADDTQTGYALTAAEVASDAAAGSTATSPVSTQGCD